MAAAKAETIHERMVAILDALPAIGKDQVNQQQRFQYRGFDDVMAALNPLLAKHGVFIVPEVIDRATSQRSTKSGSVMFEVNLHVRYTFYGAGGDSVTASAWGEGTDSGDKSTNKAMTMAFKNVLNQSFAISTREDIDADAHTPEESTGRAASSAPVAAEQKNAESVYTAEDIDKLIELVEERGGDAAKTRAGAYTARDSGKLDTWLPNAMKYWEGKDKASEFEKKAADAIVAGDAAQTARAAQAEADRAAATAPKAAA